MKIKAVNTISNKANLVFVLREGEKFNKHPLFNGLSKEDKNQLEKFIKQSNLTEDYSSMVFLPSGRSIMLICITKKFSHRNAVIIMRQVITFARKEKINKFTVNFEDFIGTDIKFNLLARVFGTQFEIANFEFVKYKTKPKQGWFFVDEIDLAVGPSFGSPAVLKKLQKAIDEGKIIGEEINNTRILSNTPGGDMTPEKLAQAAVIAGKKSGFKTRIFKEEQIKKLKMGGILGVSKGSNEPPRFIIMEYMKGKKNDKPIVLIGKGVTFDTGGLNLKSSDGIYEMHMDMSGGSAVIHTISAIARLKVKKNIIGLIPAVENMPSGSSYRPGDLLRTMSGQTIEVLNTDAEGRIILADALCYAKKYNPKLIIDIATLTGAAITALGQRVSAILATDDVIVNKLKESGELTYDFVWQLPLWEEYETEIKGTFADVCNTGKNKYGGVITAAVFLWQFIKGYNWVHIDIAPRMTTIDGEYLAKGAAGAPVAMLVDFLSK